MKILFLGDSITDMERTRDCDGTVMSYGAGYPFFVAGELLSQNPAKYEIVNRGISGNRIVDLYPRIKTDVWNLKPDVLSILIGINDIWHEIGQQNGVDLKRWERIYRMLIEDTLERLPDIKIVIIEPFVLHGYSTDGENFEKLSEIKKYAQTAKKIAEDYGLYFLPLQEKLEQKAEDYGASYYLFDGVHPDVAGAVLIAKEWVKLFQTKIERKE